jgi:arylsulfatase A-like enzyme
MRYFVALAVLGSFGSIGYSADQIKKPNIIFILADDLGWGDLGCYGNKFIPTPNLDKLAKQGTLFTHFYVGGSVCSPSRTAFISGQFPGRHAVHGHFATVELNKSRGMPQFLDPKTPTLPASLKKAGYATGHVGKWHLGHSPDAPPPEDYGFDFVKSTTSNKDTWKEQNADPFFRAKSSALFVDEGIKFIDASKDKPFYLQIWMLVPHATLNPTAEQLKPFEKFDPMNPAAGGHKSARSIFYASVVDLDAQVGRLMKQLDDKGLAENTIVIFSSDNGPEEIFIRNAGHSGVGSRGRFAAASAAFMKGESACPSSSAGRRE